MSYWSFSASLPCGLSEGMMPIQASSGNASGTEKLTWIVSPGLKSVFASVRLAWLKSGSTTVNPMEAISLPSASVSCMRKSYAPASPGAAKASVPDVCPPMYW